MLRLADNFPFLIVSILAMSFLVPLLLHLRKTLHRLKSAVVDTNSLLHFIPTPFLTFLIRLARARVHKRLDASGAMAAADFSVTVSISVPREISPGRRPEAAPDTLPTRIALWHPELDRVRAGLPPLRGRRRVLFEAHGGGWVLGSPEMGSSLKRELCQRIDCVVVSVDYVLAPEYPFPYAQEQIFGVLKWLADESDEGGARRLGVDPGEVYFLGFSAGANLLSGVSLLLQERASQIPRTLRIKHAFHIVPVLDCTVPYSVKHRRADPSVSSRTDLTPPEGDLVEHAYFRSHYSTADANAVAASPYLSPLVSATDKQLAYIPRVTVFAAGWDVLSDEAGRFAKRLQRAGVDVTYECFEQTIHSWLLRSDGEAGSNPNATLALKSAILEAFAR